MPEQLKDLEREHYRRYLLSVIRDKPIPSGPSAGGLLWLQWSPGSGASSSGDAGAPGGGAVAGGSSGSAYPSVSRDSIPKTERERYALETERMESLLSSHIDDLFPTFRGSSRLDKESIHTPKIVANRGNGFALIASTQNVKVAA